MVTPSSGCTRMTSAFCPRADVWSSANRFCGARLNTTAISVTRRPRRLPARR
ncbi:hypothetical protein BC477_13390 [Clavibacter michiganensis subsp. michiganensis]|uniref:Uncharacterized protein n=1 Tax=Clavibacter michiganensis subsp. michiganensis TaxID=33013 RepID=A0A251XIA5_CLAMM|nr:hypothetical protein BC477_13390 [Clavibacter michiganensis subsp. michiganensis]OUE02790.1 hypothetical protein CMMCAS07_12295 [Clavibacter michiganensis subsp. michiganensis]